MNINWFEIVAQIFNFIILLLLLQKFFYKPVLNAMEKRQERIAKALNEADQKMADADSIRTEYEEKIAAIKNTEREILEQAKKDALLAKEKLTNTYRNQAEEKRHAYLKEVEEEKRNFSESLRKSLAQNSVRIASNILSAASTQNLSDSIFRAFIDKILLLDTQSIGRANPSDGESLTLTSSEPVSEEQKNILEQTLKSVLGNYKSITYKTDTSLVIGYELKFETLVLHANIRRYIEESEKIIMKTLDHMS
ncbi:F0F1 ATP synthase subunit B [Anaerobium acetethylicum]|uniref:ATP synthase subunit b n=1 Tax=Anaerobium acetethylicum TaxID=1619234 RepID=A0A1D3TR79_9FIRM|nr:F0F1 ATP synthase subunit B [Anaerobium acetethylicum]SCP96146.1 ATP synthase, F0 subunit b [Anaerobium acetethylicum]